MKSFEKPPVVVLGMAVIAVGLCVAHFVTRDDAPAPSAKTTSQGSGSIPNWTREEGLQRDAKLMEEFKESRRPSLLDSKEEKATKELTRNLRQYGLNPIEMPGGTLGGSSEGIKVIDSAADMKALVDSGGYVAGMRADELEEGRK
ncbi:MAG: hypothetical protein JNL94_09770 [Planctomycetes bacterium]|nr:hypothetical protein [Planctomycetota bacterium]